MHDLVSEARGKRRVANELRFDICRDDKNWTISGMGYVENFDTFTFSEVLPFAEYEVNKKDLFAVANRVLRQTTGVAIGGTLSAQLSCLYTIHQEHLYFDRGCDEVHDYLAAFIVSTAVPAFQDNLMGRGRILGC